MARGDAAAKLAALPGAAAKTRLRKLVCAEDCGYPPIRVSRRAIALGLPCCPCGAALWPWDLDDLAFARSQGSLSDDQWTAHPLVQEFEREYAAVTQGQQGHRKRGWQALESPDALATLRVTLGVVEDAARARREGARCARAERLNADRVPVRVGASDDHDDIPF